MLFPFESTPNYWLMAMPEFEWQPDTAAIEPCGESQGIEQIVQPTEGEPAEPEAAPAQPALPPMKLVMTGMKWVVVPVWTPKDNPFWDQMKQIGCEEDTARLDAGVTDAARRRLDGLDEQSDKPRKL